MPLAYAGSVVMWHESFRVCARVGCAEHAVATLTADYAGSVMAVGPLSPEHHPPALDLCERHRDTLSAPEGWQLLRHDPNVG